MPVTTVIQNDEITPALQRLSAALENMLPVMEELGEYLAETTKARFRAGRAPDGSVWASKSPVTIARYPGSTQPLIGESKALSSTIAYEAFSDRVEWGSPMVYAAMQQFGGSKSAFPHLWGNIPARPFVGISVEDQASVLDITGDYLSEAAGEPL